MGKTSSWPQLQVMLNTSHLTNQYPDLSTASLLPLSQSPPFIILNLT